MQSADMFGRCVNANKTFAGPEFRIALNSGGLSDPAVSYACQGSNSAGWIDQTLDLSNVTYLENLIGEPTVWIGLYFENLAIAGTTEEVCVDDIFLRKCTTSLRPGLTTYFLGSELPELYQYPAVKLLDQP